MIDVHIFIVQLFPVSHYSVQMLCWASVESEWAAVGLPAPRRPQQPVSGPSAGIPWTGRLPLFTYTGGYDKK